MKNSFLIVLSFIILKFNAQVVINGYCDFPNSTISAFDIEDHITKTERKLTESTVDEQGGFKLVFPTNETKKIILRVGNNYSWMYTQTNTIYYIDIAKDAQTTQFLSDNEIEMLFFRLDSSDINYKILGFEAWMDEYLADIYDLKNNKPGEFVKKIISFKREASDFYLSDTSTFFRNYIKYSIGINIDNINFISAPSLVDKYTFYIKESEILKDHDKYMEYFENFYQNYYYQLEQKLRIQFDDYIYNDDYENGIITLMKDPFVKNREFAELLLLLMTKHKNNILENNKNLIAFIYKKSAFQHSKIVAKNILKNNETITVGTLFPLIELKNNYTIDRLKGKPIYIHCFDPSNQKCIAEIPALIKLHEKYGEYVTLVSLFVKKDRPFSTSEERSINSIKWDKFELDPNNKTWKTLNLISLPYYFLLDENLILLSAPALKPSPNSYYQTIEKIFFDFKKKGEKFDD